MEKILGLKNQIWKNEVTGLHTMEQKLNIRNFMIMFFQGVSNRDFQIIFKKDTLSMKTLGVFIYWKHRIVDPTLGFSQSNL
jgi:hypothetical protein